MVYTRGSRTMKQLPHPSLHGISLAGVLDALADPVRLSIVSALADGRERPWGALDAGVCNSTLSHHVKVLREAGLIAHRKEGTRCFVSLRPDLEDRFPGLLRMVLRFASPAGGKAAGRAVSDRRR